MIQNTPINAITNTHGTLHPYLYTYNEETQGSYHSRDIRQRNQLTI